MTHPMTPAEAKALVPKIEDALEMVGDLKATYDTSSRTASICMHDPLTGIVDPIATFATDIPPDARELLANCTVWLRALLLLRKEAARHFRQAVSAQAPQAQPEPPPRKKADPAQLASIWCQKNKAFRRFLIDACDLPPNADLNATRACVREQLDITSFTELAANPDAMRRWVDFKNRFDLWMRS